MIPSQALAHHVAILGKTGSGKTTAAKSAVERLLTEGKRICAVDPTGAWYGLRLNADGKTPGFPVVIFGGDHADIEIDGAAGAKLAGLIARGTFSSVIDTSQMTVGQRTSLFTEFAETLFRANKSPLHLVIDEAHVFAPQGRVPDPQSGKMVHAANNLVSGGRSRGLRIMLITQRPAKLHKDSLTQVETLIAMRLIAPQDRAAVEAWIGEWADPKQGREVINSLPSLAVGQGWIWAPELDLLEKATFPRIQTFDSSRAPEDGESIVTPSSLGEINIDELRAALTDEKAKSYSPSAPVERINTVDVEAIRKAAFDDGYGKGYGDGLSEGLAVAYRNSATACRDAADEIERRAKESAEKVSAGKPFTPPKASVSRETPSQDKRTEPVKAGVKPTGELDGAAKKLLEAFRRYSALTFDEACIIAGMIPGNGYFYGGKKRLLEGGYVKDAGDGRYAASDQEPDEISRTEILSIWSKLKQPAPRMLTALLQHNEMTVDALATEIDAKPGNGYWYAGVKALRDANLIEDGRGAIRLSQFVRSTK